MTLLMRTFEKYSDYIKLQGIKAEKQREILLTNFPHSVSNFKRLFQTFLPYLLPGPILCLGARTGAEVIGAEQAGYPGSIGIDLHPIGENVIEMDWHEMYFPDSSFQNIFTNSIDHCLFLNDFAKEVHRILTVPGVFIFQTTDRSPDPGGRTKYEQMLKGYEACCWDNSEELLPSFLSMGLAIEKILKKGESTTYVLRKLK